MKIMMRIMITPKMMIRPSCGITPTIPGLFIFKRIRMKSMMRVVMKIIVKNYLYNFEKNNDDNYDEIIHWPYDEIMMQNIMGIMMRIKIKIMMGIFNKSVEEL